MPKGHSSSHSSLDALANEPRTEWRSIYFITFICVMDAMRISAVLTNSWPYVAGLDAEINEEFYGLSKSAFTFGAIVASLLSGWLSNRISHTKPPILAGLLMSAMACLFFANLELIPRNRRYGFLIAEILFGIATGAISMWRVHIAMSSTDADRSKATSMVGFAVNLGFVLGPLLVLSLGYFISNRILPLPWGSHFNLFTAPIYLMGLLSLSGAILLFFCFDGRMRRMGGPKGEEADSEKWAKGRQEQLERTPLELAVPSEDQMPPCKRPSKEPGTRFDCAAILACFVARFCFTAFILYLMALGAPYTMSVFGWTGQQMVLFQMLSQCTMGLMGILICLGYTLRLLSRFKERFCVLGALSMMLGFFLASYPWPFLGARLPDPIYVNETSVNGTVVQKLVSHGCDRHKFDWCEETPAINIVFYHVTLIICLGLAMPVGQLNLDVLYSRLLGPIKQGTMQGLFVAVGDLVTLCGPLIITALYQRSGPRLIWLGEIALFLLGIAFWAFCYGRLVPSGYQAVPQAESAPVSEDTKWDVTNVDRREAQPKIFQAD